MATIQRKTLTLTIDLEGAAFNDGFGDLEIGHLLRDAAAKIEAGALAENGARIATGRGVDLIDSNGNRVGYAGVTLKRTRV